MNKHECKAEYTILVSEQCINNMDYSCSFKNTVSDDCESHNYKYIPDRTDECIY